VFLLFFASRVDCFSLAVSASRADKVAMSWLSTTAEMALFNVKSGFLGASSCLAVSVPIDWTNVLP
jgi:hypothetical protein